MRGAPRIVLVAVSLAAIAAYAYIALRRMSYPYDLEWIEGGILQHVERVQDGKPLYREPTAEFAPLLYAPLYYYVAAAFGLVFDTGLTLLRAVSFAASLGCMALSYVLVRGETGSRAAGVVAAGLFAAVYDQVGGWFDLARVDSLFLLLLIAAALVARRARAWPAAAAAGVLIVLAVYAKQQAALAVPALFLFFALGRRDWARALAFGATAAVGIAAVYLVWDASSDGWFSFFVFELGAQHPGAPQYRTKFFTEDMGIVAPALLVGALAVWTWWRARDVERLAFYVPLGLAVAAGSLASRLHDGGYPNVVLPAYLLIAVMAGVGLGVTRSRGLALAAALALLVQFGMLAYDPGRYIPSDADRARSDGAVAAIRALPGDVYVASYPIYARRAGKPVYVHNAAAIDILRADDSEQRTQFEARYGGALAAGCFSRLVGAGFDENHYVRVGPLVRGERVQAISGLPVPVGDVYVPRTGAPPDRSSCPTPRS